MFAALAYELIKNPPSRSRSACLAHLHHALSAIIAREKPDALAVEGVFFCKNLKTAVVLGEARGAVLAAAAAAGIPVHEYAPRRVKQAVVGHGNASKEQVRRMIMKLLNLQEEPHTDASDALAIALCHLQTVNSWSVLASKTL